jgi:hypothetical protein
MSLNYSVVCREKLPARADGWTLQVGPVQVAESADVKAAALAGVPGGAVLALVGDTDSESMVEAVGLMLARVSRGVVLREGKTVTEDCRDLPAPKLDAEGLLDALEELTKETTLPPKAAPSAEADDWSDVG